MPVIKASSDCTLYFPLDGDMMRDSQLDVYQYLCLLSRHAMVHLANVRVKQPWKSGHKSHLNMQKKLVIGGGCF